MKGQLGCILLPYEIVLDPSTVVGGDGAALPASSCSSAALGPAKDPGSADVKAVSSSEANKSPSTHEPLSTHLHHQSSPLKVPIPQDALVVHKGYDHEHNAYTRQSKNDNSSARRRVSSYLQVRQTAQGSTCGVRMSHGG